MLRPWAGSPVGLRLSRVTLLADQAGGQQGALGAPYQVPFVDEDSSHTKGDLDMKAISLWQPYAWMVAHAGKNIENRGWTARHLVGEDIAIHAGMRLDEEALQDLVDDGFEPPPPGRIEHGCIVAVARLARVITDADPEARDSNWFVGPYGFVLEDVVAIDPVPTRGQQKFWNLPSDVTHLVVRRRAEAVRDKLTGTLPPADTVATTSTRVPRGNGMESLADGPVTGPLDTRLLGRNDQGLEEHEYLKDGTVLILVPGGTFTMGSSDGDQDERPPHLVALPPYCIAKTPVTNAQFRRFVTHTGYEAEQDWEFHARGWDDLAPVVAVSWNDAMAYCQWAGLRLPTEAEWEFAARGPGGSTFPWGDAWDPERLIWRGNSAGRAQPVGSIPAGASPVGALDMAGNVWEWCSSKYKRYPYQSGDGRETLDGTERRAVRGASWDSPRPSYFRCANRYTHDPDYLINMRGFRCARDVV